MKRLPLTAALLLLCGSVFAGTYSQANARGKFCSNIGRFSKLAYNDRVIGTPKATVLERVASGLNKGDKGAALLQYAIDYGYDKATDSEDAHMNAWAKCMDETQ